MTIIIEEVLQILYNLILLSFSLWQTLTRQYGSNWEEVRLRINTTGKAVDFQISYKEKGQIAEAVEYCKRNGCRGQKALLSDLFPLIKNSNVAVCI